MPRLTTPFLVAGSSDIHFDRVDVHGDPHGSLATDESGFVIRDTDNVSVTRSEFSHLHDPLMHFQDTHITISGNYIHDNRDDGIRGGGSSWLLISGNRCESDHPDRDDLEHPDCIQVWTTNTKASAHDITITDNIYIRGKGLPNQGIFVQDELGNLPLENVKVTNNVIIGSMWNGIYVKHGHNVEISGNTVARLSRPIVLDHPPWRRHGHSQGQSRCRLRLPGP